MHDRPEVPAIDRRCSQFIWGKLLGKRYANSEFTVAAYTADLAEDVSARRLDPIVRQASKYDAVVTPSQVDSGEVEVRGIFPYTLGGKPFTVVTCSAISPEPTYDGRTFAYTRFVLLDQADFRRLGGNPLYLIGGASQFPPIEKVAETFDDCNPRLAPYSLQATRSRDAEADCLKWVWIHEKSGEREIPFLFNLAEAVLDPRRLILLGLEGGQKLSLRALVIAVVFSLLPLEVRLKLSATTASFDPTTCDAHLMFRPVTGIPLGSSLLKAYWQQKKILYLSGDIPYARKLQELWGALEGYPHGSAEFLERIEQVEATDIILSLGADQELARRLHQANREIIVHYQQKKGIPPSLLDILDMLENNWEKVENRHWLLGEVVRHAARQKLEQSGIELFSRRLRESGQIQQIIDQVPAVLDAPAPVECLPAFADALLALPPGNDSAAILLAEALLRSMIEREVPLGPLELIKGRIQSLLSRSSTPLPLVQRVLALLPMRRMTKEYCLSFLLELMEKIPSLQSLTQILSGTSFYQALQQDLPETASLFRGEKPDWTVIQSEMRGFQWHLPLLKMVQASSHFDYLDSTLVQQMGRALAAPQLKDSLARLVEQLDKVPPESRPLLVYLGLRPGVQVLDLLQRAIALATDERQQLSFIESCFQKIASAGGESVLYQNLIRQLSQISLSRTAQIQMCGKLLDSPPIGLPREGSLTGWLQQLWKTRSSDPQELALFVSDIEPHLARTSPLAQEIRREAENRWSVMPSNIRIALLGRHFEQALASSSQRNEWDKVEALLKEVWTPEEQVNILGMLASIFDGYLQRTDVRDIPRPAQHWLSAYAEGRLHLVPVADWLGTLVDKGSHQKNLPLLSDVFKQALQIHSQRPNEKLRNLLSQIVGAILHAEVPARDRVLTIARLLQNCQTEEKRSLASFLQKETASLALEQAGRDQTTWQLWHAALTGQRITGTTRIEGTKEIDPDTAAELGLLAISLDHADTLDKSFFLAAARGNLNCRLQIVEALLSQQQTPPCLLGRALFLACLDSKNNYLCRILQQGREWLGEIAAAWGELVEEKETQKLQESPWLSLGIQMRSIEPAVALPFYSSLLKQLRTSDFRVWIGRQISIILRNCRDAGAFTWINEIRETARKLAGYSGQEPEVFSQLLRDCDTCIREVSKPAALERAKQIISQCANREDLHRRLRQVEESLAILPDVWQLLEALATDRIGPNWQPLLDRVREEQPELFHPIVSLAQRLNAGEPGFLTQLRELETRIDWEDRIKNLETSFQYQRPDEMAPVPCTARLIRELFNLDYSHQNCQLRAERLNDIRNLWAEKTSPAPGPGKKGLRARLKERIGNILQRRSSASEGEDLAAELTMDSYFQILSDHLSLPDDPQQAELQIGCLRKIGLNKEAEVFWQAWQRESVPARIIEQLYDVVQRLNSFDPQKVEPVREAKLHRKCQELIDLIEKPKSNFRQVLRSLLARK